MEISFTAYTTSRKVPGGYLVSCSDLGIYANGDTQDRAVWNFERVLEAWLYATIKTGKLGEAIERRGFVWRSDPQRWPKASPGTMTIPVKATLYPTKRLSSFEDIRNSVEDKELTELSYFDDTSISDVTP